MNMTPKEKFKKFSKEKQHELAYQLGMSIIKKKIEAEEGAEEMAKAFEKLTGHKPSEECKKQVKELLSL